MKIKLDQHFRDIIVCPLCKTHVSWSLTECVCDNCGSKFHQLKNGVWNFIINYPYYVSPQYHKNWLTSQDNYETFELNRIDKDDSQAYIDEIDSVYEIYSKEFNLKGKILDVGGGIGRLRHFLTSNDSYISIDPFYREFEAFQTKKNILKFYKCLNEPCNFIMAQAEHLPFKESSFNFVHMRSVLDHFSDPYLALLEARRVLFPDGGLMIGVSTGDNIVRTPALTRFLNYYQHEGATKTIKSTINFLINRIKENKDPHIWLPSTSEILDICKKTNFNIEKIHWQKPPYNYCIYLLARKNGY